LRKFLIVAVACATLFVTALFAGPVSSGPWLLLLPTPARRVEHDLPPDYEPLHKGGEYKNGGRLARVTSSDGSIRRYQYNDRHELTVIEEPGTSIENHFENGRCVRQINRFGDGSTPYVFDFRYDVKEERVVGTESRRSDGTWVRYRWNESGAAVSESLGHDEQEAFSLTYERDATSQVVTALTLTCPDRRGQPLRHTSIVSDGNEDAIKRGLLETHCSWRRYTAARHAGPPAAEGK